MTVRHAVLPLSVAHMRAWLARWRADLCVVLMTGAATVATLLPHFWRPMVLDEFEFITAAQGIRNTGVPVYYRGGVDLTTWARVGQTHVPGFPGLSTLWESSDGFFTLVQHGATIDWAGNWHPELYLYLLAPLLGLPIPGAVAARLLNLLCLEASALLIFAITRRALESAGGSRRWTFVVPFLASLVYILDPYTTREYVLIDFSGTLSSTTVLLFWYMRLRAGPRWRDCWLPIVAFALVPWSNLGPLPAVMLTLALSGALDCLTGTWRRGVRTFAVLGGGVGLFYVTFYAYGIWAGLPAALTLAHNNVRVVQALARVPWPLAWRHLGAQRGTFLLWALALGPWLLAAGGLVVGPWIPALRSRLRADVLTTSIALSASAVASLLGTAAFGVWQGIGAGAGTHAAVASLPQLARFFWANWLTVPHQEWMVTALALCVTLLTLGVRGWEGDDLAGSTPDAVKVIREMALFALIMGGDLLFLMARAWGFPKYQGPVFSVCVPLAAIFVFITIKRHPRSSRGAVLFLAGVAGGIAWLATWPVPETADPALYRLGTLAAIGILLTGAWVSVRWAWGARLSAQWPGGTRPLIVAGLLVLTCTPLLVAAGREAFVLPGEHGSITYLEGTSWGQAAAGAYLHDHVRPGDMVIVRKDIGYYSGVPYTDDFPWWTPIPVTGRQVVWAARIDSPGPGFELVWRGPEFNVYRYALLPAAPE